MKNPRLNQTEAEVEKAMSELAKQEEREGRDELADVHCPNCDHPLTEPINDIWKDMNVRAALKDGRTPDDIAVLSCPKCGRWGYYNQGSTFWCRFCRQGWECLSEGDDPPADRQYLLLDGFTTLADTVTVTTDGYDNQTLGSK